MTAAEMLPRVRRPNELPDRAAMGLPSRFVTRLPADLFARHAELLSGAPADLVRVCEDSSEPFGRRYVAGSVLALRGDPRVRPADPVLVDVPAGEVALGLPEDRVAEVVARWERVGVLADWIRKECPRHRVHIDAFRIMRYPVTNLEYREFLLDTGLGALPTSWRFGRFPTHRANHPVWTVHPGHAESYATWLSERTGRRFRLPTEAEWEYAAGGGLDREYPWGDEFLPDHANTVEDGPLTTTPIGIYPAGRSPFGADDMAGNVEEFVADDYRPYPGGQLVDDDLRLAADSYRVARGGSFTRFGDLARCRRRHGWFRRDIYAMGFRLVEDS
jgi:formylglycine-generating enzyme required for sulfatase activity